MKTEIQLPNEEMDESQDPQVSRDESPFQKAKTLPKKLKLFLYGPSGSGKTTLSLQFPKPVVLDLEGGTDLYGESFDFDVLRATNADEIMQAVQWLLTHEHQYKTLVIDPITIYWDSLQKKWSDIFLRRNRGTKGHRHEFYDLQPRDWMTLKSELKDLIRKLISLDMTVIVTARQKTQYADGSFMKAIGETFDGEKSLPYLFDTIVKLYRDDKGRFLGECIKDRSNKLPPGEFECSYTLFEKLFGKEVLTRNAKPITFATDEQKNRLKILFLDMHFPMDAINKRLTAYDAETIDDLTFENAEIIINKLETFNKEKKEK